MTELNWKHHTLIQALLSRGPLMEVEFHKIFRGISGKNPVTNQKLFDDYLLEINKALSYVQFELRCCRQQYDGHVYYGVVNNVSDDQSKMGTKYSVPQIAFYKAIIEAIVQDDRAQGNISNIGALNLHLESQVTDTTLQSQGGHCPAIKNFSLSLKEKALQELIHDQWLKQTPDGNIGLGIRSFLDLRSWFRNNDVPSCEACNEAAVKAELCQNEECTTRIHHYCLKKFFGKRKGGRVCPHCGTEWKIHESNEETFEEDEHQETLTTDDQVPPEPKRRRPKTEDQVPPEAKRKRPKTKNVGESSTQGSVGSSLPRRVTRSYAHAR